jgi:uracil-DNA glycosylase
MEVDSDDKLMFRVLQCEMCKNDDRTRGLIPERCYPVYSFGDPENKEVITVGLNPSRIEYEKGFLSRDPRPEKRAESQLSYFQVGRHHHTYFDALDGYFSQKAKRLLQCKEHMWENVGFLDLVKCVTIKAKSDKNQWGGLKRIPKEAIIGNCEDYLMQQIWFYRPKLLISYGQDATHWIERNRRRLPEDIRCTWIPQRRYQKTKDFRKHKLRLEREIIKWKAE